ncbi:MAG: iron-sulfur cluster assembly scaffold protein [Candidatus Nanohaloarchaea archaeon]
MTRNLYREKILEHYRNPSNRGEVGDPDIEAEVSNPNCGDEIRMAAEVENGVIREVGFEGEGCALGIASVSMLTEELEGRNMEESVEDDEIFDMLGLDPEHVSSVRRKCVLLSKKAFQEMVEDERT